LNKIKVILIIASSIDGRIALPNGGCTSIGSIEDKKLLNESLKQVDATIFGSGTLKAHKSTFLVKNFKKGSHYNLDVKQPISIVAGNISDFSPQWLYFNQPIERWLVKKNSDSENDDLEFNKELLFQGTWSKTLELIKKEGIKNIALLGGSKLVNSFAKENLIDEIKITIVPKILGGSFEWISSKNTQSIYGFNNDWIIQSFKKINTNEIFIHYTRSKRD